MSFNLFDEKLPNEEAYFVCIFFSWEEANMTHTQVKCVKNESHIWCQLLKLISVSFACAEIILINRTIE